MPRTNGTAFPRTDRRRTRATDHRGRRGCPADGPETDEAPGRWPGASCVPFPSADGLPLAGAGEKAGGKFVVQFQVAFEIPAVALGEFLRDGVRNRYAFSDCHPVADLAEHA